MTKKVAVFLFILTFFNQALPTLAITNNKFGIHLTQPEDLPKAKELVNSQGGDWGYVTIVIAKNDRNKEKWQSFFDLSREYHLIPLVRLATEVENGLWKKPDPDDLFVWADFLDSLNWPTKNRYVIVFNEPNHLKEWGGQINPQEYAKILEQAIVVFKNKNTDFFLLNAGFDQAAANTTETMNEKSFLEQINAENPGLFAKLDGWVSHSYPNHGYVGKPWESGRATIKGYEWELSLLKSLGVEKNLPVFIAETGWPHSLNEKLKMKNEKFYDEKTTAKFIQQAYENVWLPDERVMVVTPFILNYPFPPFEHFSWLNKEGRPYLQYEEVKKIAKSKGEPEQLEKYKIVSFFAPPISPTKYHYSGKITLENTGQSIWGEKPFKLESWTSGGGLKVSTLILPKDILIKPGEKFTFEFSLESQDLDGQFAFSWIGLPGHKIRVFKPWSVVGQPNSFLFGLLQKIFTF